MHYCSAEDEEVPDKVGGSLFHTEGDKPERVNNAAAKDKSEEGVISRLNQSRKENESAPAENKVERYVNKSEP